MSEQVVEQKPIPQNVNYVLYDPARRRRRARRRRLDPTLVAYEPRRRRARRFRRLDPVRVGGRAMADSVVDGLGFGLVSHLVPGIPSGSLGPVGYRDAAAGVITFAYEKWYMRRGWTSAILGAIAGIATSKLVDALGGWKK